jgi:hypothetical protein
MCCLLCSSSNQYMQKEKFPNNKGMVNSNLNILSMWCILFWKPPLYANVIDYSLVCINVMYVAFKWQISFISGTTIANYFSLIWKDGHLDIFCITMLCVCYFTCDIEYRNVVDFKQTRWNEEIMV